MRSFLIIKIFFTAILAISVSGCQKSDPSFGPKIYANSMQMMFAYVPPGRFTMGSPPGEFGRHPDETPHEVTLSRGFYMGIFEVTQAQWHAVMNTSPSEFNTCGGQCPVDSVSWHDVQRFIDTLNRLEKTDQYRLPTEAEWEYACRAGTVTLFSFGNCLSDSRANFDAGRTMPGCEPGGFRKSPAAAATFSPNPWGLHDMHGNVWEWCQDWYDPRFYSDRQTDPRGPDSGKYRVIRGGSWFSVDHDCRSANRDRCDPDLRLNFIGFRLVKTIPN